MAKFKRILLKLSGESLMGEQKYGIDEKRLAEYAAQIKEIHDMGVEIGIVIGGQARLIPFHYLHPLLLLLRESYLILH